MSKHAIEKSPETVRAANRWLDSAAPLSMLENHFGYTQQEIEKLHKKRTGKSLDRTTMWRFRTRKKDSLPGISDVFIAEAAVTETGIAEAALQQELMVRRASYALLIDASPENTARLLHRLDVARDKVNALRSLIKSLAPASEADTARAIDLASVDYLDGQIHIHRARLLQEDETEEKIRRFKASSALMEAVSSRLHHAVKSGMRNAELIDVILAVNAGLNAYFTAWELDDLLSDETLQRAKAAAQKVAAPLFLKAANESAEKQNDSRVAFNAASAAGLARQDIPASRSLKLAAQLDGFKGKITDWNPAWMLERLDASAELAKAIEILNREGEIK